MSVLALKAISYGAEQIPDRFFEKIPGGFFKPEGDKKNGKKNRSPSKERNRRSKDRSRREQSHQSSYSDHSDTSSSHEEEQSKDRGYRKSTGRSTSRSFSRGRDKQRSRDVDGEYDGKDMAYAEHGQGQGQGQGPYFPPPPASEYRPYDAQAHASRSNQDSYQTNTAQSQYGYPMQVNSPFRSRSTTLPMMASYSMPVNSCLPMLLNRPPSNASSPFAGLQPHLFDHLRRGTPVSASFSPSYEPPLAALLRCPPTNTPQPAHAQTFPVQTPVNRPGDTSPPVMAYGDEAAHRYEEIQHSKSRQSRSASAARYTPGPGYAPSPVVMPAAPIPPPPVGVNSPPVSTGVPYAPYNPAAYAVNNSAYRPASGTNYASPPPFYRQPSRSQPSFDQNQQYSSYSPRSSDQQIAYHDDRHSPSRRSSTKHDRREHRHRARSADSRSSRHESSRVSDIRGRFDDMDLRTKNLGATVAGALAGGLAGRAAGKSRLTMLAGAAAGALGGQAVATRNVDR